MNIKEEKHEKRREKENEVSGGEAQAVAKTRTAAIVSGFIPKAPEAAGSDGKQIMAE